MRTDLSKLSRWPGYTHQHTEILLRLYQAGERDFRGLSFHKLQLDGAVLRGADFSGSSVSGSFEGSDLREANFTDADVHAVRMTKAHLEHACFQGANLSRADLNEAFLQKANFTRASFFRVKLERADLTDARFVHADFRDIVLLEGAQLTGACFDEANLTDFRFPEGTWPRMSFRGALHGTQISHTRPTRPAFQLPPGYTHEAEGTRRVGPGAALAELDLRGFHFRRLDLTGADFTGADLREASFSKWT